MKSSTQSPSKLEEPKSLDQKKESSSHSTNQSEKATIGKNNKDIPSTSDSESDGSKIRGLTLEEQKIEIERERLQLEKDKAQFEQRFFNKNFGTIITSIISVAAVIITWNQFSFTLSQRASEIKESDRRYAQEREEAQAKYDRETQSQLIRYQQEEKLNLARFVADNADKIFGRDEEQRKLILKAILNTFPKEHTTELFANLEARATTPEAKEDYRRAKNQASSSLAVQASTTFGSIIGRLIDADSNAPIKGATVIALDPSGGVESTQTNETGHFNLPRMPTRIDGRYYLISAQAKGYFLASKGIQVYPDQRLDLSTISLRRFEMALPIVGERGRDPLKFLEVPSPDPNSNVASPPDPSP